MNQPQRYSMVLVPCDIADVLQLCAFSKNLFGSADSEYVCGIHSYPHLTVAQVEATATDILRVQQVLGALPAFSTNIDIQGFYARADDEQVMWTGLSIKPDEALQNFHERAVDALEAEGFAVANGARKNYWPHITTARLHTPVAVDMQQMNCHVFKSKPIAMMAEHGPSGARWTYCKALPQAESVG